MNYIKFGYLNNMQPVVSIIVAVYNVEDLLSRCLDSIINQTFTNFEVILINDGSKDNSGKICDEYALKDCRFRVIHQDNQGVSKVREKGIKSAIGEYTIHVDPDDWIESNMLERLVEVAKSDDADIVICDYFVNRNDSQIRKCERPINLNPRNVLCELFYRLTGSLWNKLIRRILYENIPFVNGVSCGEDYLTCMRLLKRAGKVSYLPEAFYHYDVSSNQMSLTKSGDVERFQRDENKILQIYKSEILENQYTKEYNSQVCSFAWAAFVKRLYSNREFRARYRKSLWALLNNRLPLAIRLFSGLSAIGFYSVCIKIYDFALKARK